MFLIGRYICQVDRRKYVANGRKRKMKHFLLIIPITLFVYGQAVFADEVTKCFEKAWEHPENGGLGLNRGQAIKLCNGASNAVEVIKCFEKAWEHPSNGGLGLNQGQAVKLCNSASNAVKVTKCFEKAWEHPSNGGLGLTRGGAIELCTSSVNR